MKESFIDKDLGHIILVRNIRARRIIARRRHNYIQLTVPVNCPLKEVEKILEKLKPRIMGLSFQDSFLFNEDTVLQTVTFDVKIILGEVWNYYSSLKDGILYIVCPSLTDFGHEEVQGKIKSIVESALRKEAKSIFPGRIEYLAKKYGFTYNTLRITKSRSRWGSCSSKKSINLSYYCMLLPGYLLDFVILHELCHTIEMNHGKGFWILLDKVTGDKAKALTKELNTHKIRW